MQFLLHFDEFFVIFSVALYFSYFPTVFLYFVKRVFHAFSFWKMGRQLAKKASNAYPDTAKGASGHCLDIFALNLGRSAQKMSKIGFGVT